MAALSAGCLAAHTYTGTHVTKLSLEEIAVARRGRSSEARADAAVKFAVRVPKRGAAFPNRKWKH
ncbi:hypothetical protein [Rhizobium ruizarguesonis]|uniref:hypothetical protein n=1 Tax=Rhizobium ruizarguesonis TaxID=2081791 RepID=UPI001FDEEB9F|nr:hypothetical protein [Rhizobium ruizarguesonis]